MKKFILFLTLIAAGLFVAKAESTETLNYVISYKWGLIHKEAGDAQLIRTPKNNGYELKLIGKTKPWADRFYKVRDTLISDVKRLDYSPRSYSKIAHEKGKYSRDDLTFDYTGDVVKGLARQTRVDKDGQIRIKEKELEGESPVYDMLSVFYFLRNIDYESLQPDETLKATIFSGTLAESLTVRCKGIEKIKLKDKREEEAWHIVFKFTSRGGKKTSDDIDCWISTDKRHIPLLVVGSLPVGQVRCTYVPD